MIRNQVRVEQTKNEINYLGREIEAWMARRRDADKKGQYHTQLNTLQEILTTAIMGLCEQTDGIITSQSNTGQVYDECRLCERRLLWVRRVLWGYFREKFDQRDDPAHKAVLEAADDVVWSCYADAFGNAAFFSGRPIPRRPVPLAYIEPYYSPQAIPRDDPPGNLKETKLGDRFLKDYFSQLPIPVVSLPPNCLNASWWLVYLGHEVGHHVQHDLTVDMGLILSFGNRLRTIATTDPAPSLNTAAAERWYRWGQEIFADVFSICTLGLSAVQAIEELETAPEAAMLLAKERYPAPVVRLALLTAVAGKLGLDAGKALRDIEPDALVTGPPPNDIVDEWQREAAADIEMVPKMARGLATMKLDNFGTFKDLAGWRPGDFSPNGTLYRWRAALLGDQPQIIEKQRRSARLIAGAAMQAREVVVGDKELETTARAEKLAALHEATIAAIDNNREPGTRTTDKTAVPDVAPVAEDMTHQLLQTTQFDW